MFRSLCDDLVSIIVDIYEDNSFYDRHVKAVKTFELEVNGIYDNLLKLRWFYHHLRAKIIFYTLRFNESKYVDRLPYCSFNTLKFDLPTGSLQSSYIEFFRLLRKDPVLVAEILHYYKFNAHVVESLFSSVCSAICTNPVDTPSNLVQLTIAHYLQQCLHNVKCAMYSKSELMLLVHLLIFGTPDVFSFLSSVLQNVFYRFINSSSNLSINMLEYDKNSAEFPSNVSPGTSTVMLLNIIISSLSDNILLFPQSVLILLGNMRRIWSTANLSHKEVLRACVEFIFKDFIGYAFEKPALYNINLSLMLSPTFYAIFKETIEVISSIVIEGENYSLTAGVTNQNGSAIIHNECTKIDYDRLQGFAQFILGAADSMASPNNLFEKCSENLLVAENKLQHPESDNCISKGSCNCDIVSITSNNLNILVGCTRIFLQKKLNSHPFLKIIDRLPHNVPGATVEVELSVDNASFGDASSSDTNISAVLVDISENNTTKTLTREIKRSNSNTPSPQRRRSRSLNRLFNGKYNFSSHSRDTHIDNAGVVNPSLSGKNVKSNDENSEFVYLFNLYSYHCSHHQKMPSQNQVDRSREVRVDRNKTDHLVDESTSSHSDDASVTTSHVYSDIVRKVVMKDTNQTACCFVPSSVSSGCDRSSHPCFDQYYPISEIHVTGNVNAEDGQCNLCESHCSPRGDVINNLSNEKHSSISFSHNHFLTGQRSSDEAASQNSDPSGCTSLASSACALGRRLETTTSVNESLQDKNVSDLQLNQGTPHPTSVSGPSINSSSHIYSFSPPASPKHSFSNSRSDVNDRTTQYVACSSLSRGVEKRTRFSISVLPSSNSVRGFENSSLIPDHGFMVQSKISETRCVKERSSVHPSVVRCSSIDLFQSGLINHSNPLTEREYKFDGHKSNLDFVSSIPVSNKMLRSDDKPTIQPRCSSLTSLCASAGISSLPAHRVRRHSQKLLTSTSNQDTEGQGTPSFSVDSASSDNDSDSGLIGAAVSQHSTASSSCHLNSSFIQSYQNSHDHNDVREVDEQSSLLTCSSCGVRLGEDVIPDPIPENVESQDVDINSDQIETQVDEQSSYPRDEEDALSDLPLSSANISGRVTPLSLTSTTSRGGQLAQPNIHGTENNYRVSAMFSQSGIILPTGTALPSNTTHLGLTRCGPNEFPSTMFQRHCTPDVTEKFNKFDLPPNRMTENETRSTVSDTWSTDVLPSDTEYTDLGQEFSNSQSNLNPDAAVRRLSSHSVTRVSHRRGHRHHHRRAPMPESLINESSENNNFRSANVPSESDNRETQPRVHSSSPLNDAINVEENENNLHALNDSIHPVIMRSSPTTSQCQDNLGGLSQPINSDHSNHHCSVSLDSAVNSNHHASSVMSTKIDNSCNACEKVNGEFRSSTDDERRNMNTHRLHGGAHTLKESFSRLMGKLDLMARRPRISGNSSIDKHRHPSTQYNESQSNLYSFLPDLMESVSVKSGTYSSHDNQQHLSASSTSFLPNSNQSKQLAVKSQSSSQCEDDSMRKEETVDEMMERYRRQTKVVSPDKSIFNHNSNSQYSHHDKQIPSTSNSNKMVNNNTAVSVGNVNSSDKNFSSIPSLQLSSSSSASSSSSYSLSPVCSQSCKSIPHLFNLALNGLQEIFSNSQLNIIALNTIQKLKSTWQMTCDNRLLPRQSQDITGVFTENQIFFSLLNSMLAGLYGTQQNSTIINILIETRNILLELNNLFENCLNPNSSTINDKPVNKNNTENNSNQNGHLFNFTDKTLSYSLTKCLISSLRQYLRQQQVYRIQLKKDYERLNKLKSNLQLSVKWLQQSIHLQQEYITNRNLLEFINQNRKLFIEFHQEFTSDELSCDPKLRVEMVQKLVTQLINKMKSKWRESCLNDCCISTHLSSSSTLSLFHKCDVSQLSMNILRDNSITNDNNVESAIIQLERLVMDEIYPFVIWINNPSVEKERDELFHRELAFLQNTVTPTELRISNAYHIVLPLKSVQNELLLLDCYHTSSDKLRCLKRVINHVLAALQLANPTSIPCADDLLPVLIYLIIHVSMFTRYISHLSFSLSRYHIIYESTFEHIAV
ncbi:unnamed protein product [Schistosoma rodhaini]|uniref:VPS9 domain-containing protein n=1 Tax=Schistosoma rodhaini TaxID=6188 RepID=A0AA85FFU7_9TREM|nr:unnamed protein product [Schistosoma rodhaini]